MKFLLLLLLPWSVAAADACRPWSETDQGDVTLVVGDIEVKTANVFDLSLPEENRWFHRFTNEWHRPTRPNVVRQQLLFRTGDTYSRRVLDETERNLRSTSYLHRVTIRETEVCNGVVNLLVETSDNWSLSTNFSLERAGGENEYRFEVREANLFGSGRALLFRIDSSVDRESRTFFFSDPAFRGTRQQVSLQLDSNSDGEGTALRWQKPFYGLDSRDAWQVSVSNQVFGSSTFEDGRAVQGFTQRRRNLNVSRGFSAGLIQGAATRYSGGLIFDEAEVSLVVPVTSVTSASDEPDVRRFVYPFLGIEYLQDRYVKRSNLSLLETIEDVSLGHRVSASVGWSSQVLGANLSGLIISGGYSRGFQPSEFWLGQVSASASVRVSNAGVDQATGTARLRSFRFLSRRQQLFFQASLSAIDNPFREQQLLLGGDTGLRGYPLRIQSGDRRAIATAEYRFFPDWYPWRLLRFGFATFVDAGQAWRSDGDEPALLTDVGVGLRAVWARQANNRVLHIDLAKPVTAVDGVDDVSGVQLVIKTKAEF